MKTFDVDNSSSLIVSNLSELILYFANIASSEQYHPTFDSDKSDETIADNIKRVDRLRNIRNEFENLITGVLL